MNTHTPPNRTTLTTTQTDMTTPMTATNTHGPAAITPADAEKSALEEAPSPLFHIGGLEDAFADAQHYHVQLRFKQRNSRKSWTLVEGLAATTTFKSITRAWRKSFGS